MHIIFYLLSNLKFSFLTRYGSQIPLSDVVPTSGYSRGETPTAEAEALAKKEKVPTTTTRQGLTPYQFLERFAQKFPRKGGSKEILDDFSGNFVENSLDGHPHVHPLIKIATQSLVSTTSTTTTTPLYTMQRPKHVQ